MIQNKKNKAIKVLGIKFYEKKIKGNKKKCKILFGLLSSKTTPNRKKYYIMGLQICTKRKPNQLTYSPVKLPPFNYTNAFIMEYFCQQQQLKYRNNLPNINDMISNAKNIMISCSENYLIRSHGWTKYLFNGNLYGSETLPYDNKGADLFILLGGINTSTGPINTVVEAMQTDKPVLIMEAAFLRSVNTFCECKEDPKYRYDVGFVLDSLTAYYDATKPSFLEIMLNDKNLIITDEQKKRARKCIDKIIKNHLTKYNSQPIFTPSIGRDGAKKILVVDQSFGDNSIKKGLASINTFEKMLKSAIEENPNADIIVKTHPDTKTGSRTGYYSDLEQKDNIYLYTDPINPISLINYVDKVYVCSTQLGFEACMCGKETHVFGMPFYAGWGITIDEQKCSRRTNKRTLEEIFYITYIMYSYYINPDKQCRCEIEEAMDFLINLRNEYFQKKGILNEKI